MELGLRAEHKSLVRRPPADRRAGVDVTVKQKPVVCLEVVVPAVRTRPERHRRAAHLRRDVSRLERHGQRCLTDVGVAACHRAELPLRVRPEIYIHICRDKPRAPYHLADLLDECGDFPEALVREDALVKLDAPDAGGRDALYLAEYRVVELGVVGVAAGCKPVGKRPGRPVAGGELDAEILEKPVNLRALKVALVDRVQLGKGLFRDVHLHTSLCP